MQGYRTSDNRVTLAIVDVGVDDFRVRLAVHFLELLGESRTHHTHTVDRDDDSLMFGFEYIAFGDSKHS